MQVIAILLCLLVIVQVQRKVYERLWDKNLSADVSFQKKNMIEGETVKVDITVMNDKWLPLPALSVIFSLPQQFTELQTKQKSFMNTYNRNELFTLYSHQSVKRTLTFACRQRGVYSVDELMLLNRSLLMDREDTQMLPLNRRLTVYPSCVNMRNFVRTFQNTIGEILTNDFMNEDVFLIRSIREYKPFDSRHAINWKSTAKMGRLMVNNYEYTNSRKVAVFLNLTQNELSQEGHIAEESIRLAKTWCMNLSKYGIECDLYTNGREAPDGGCLTVETARLTQKYMYHVNETLARIACCPDGPEFADVFADEIEAHERDCFLVFISADCREGFQNALCALKRRRAKLVWVIPKSSSGSYKLDPALADVSIGWNVYWRKEEHFETIRF